MTNAQAVVYFLVQNRGQACTNRQIAEATGRPLPGITAETRKMADLAKIVRDRPKQDGSGRVSYLYSLTPDHPALRTASAQILDYLRDDATEPQTTTEVRAALPWIDGNTVSKTLSNLWRRGRVIREGEPASGGVGGYRYSLPSEAPPVATEPVEEPEVEQDAPSPEVTAEPEVPADANEDEAAEVNATEESESGGDQISLPETGEVMECPEGDTPEPVTLVERLTDIYRRAVEATETDALLPHRIEGLRFAANIAERIHYIENAPQG